MAEPERVELGVILSSPHMFSAASVVANYQERILRIKSKDVVGSGLDDHTPLRASRRDRAAH